MKAPATSLSPSGLNVGHAQLITPGKEPSSLPDMGQELWTACGPRGHVSGSISRAGRGRGGRAKVEEERTSPLGAPSPAHLPQVTVHQGGRRATARWAEAGCQEGCMCPINLWWGVGEARKVGRTDQLGLQPRDSRSVDSREEGTPESGAHPMCPAGAWRPQLS